MKRPFLFLAGAILSGAASAQTMTIHQGATHIVYPISDLEAMTYGTQESDSRSYISVQDHVFFTEAIDSITVQADATPWSDYVEVNYDGAVASVVMPGSLAAYLETIVNGADVEIVASEDLAEEITYRLGGTSTDGSFTQNGSYKMTMILCGLNLNSTSGAAIDIENGKRIKVELAEGTVNTLSDAVGGAQKACFFVKGHPEFSGAGTLNITGNAKHAFASNEYTELKSSFGTLNILAAASDGMHVDQYFKMNGGNVSISGVAGDGIDCSATNDATDENNGQVLLLGGTLTIDTGASDDVKGIKVETDMTITGATVTINGTGDGVKGIKVGGNLTISQANDGAATAVTITESGTTYHKDQADESKTRGIKVDGNFTFDGGTLTVSTPGKKAKNVVVDGTYYYKSGNLGDTVIEAANAE